jgi:hypothetical protein
MVHIMWRRWFVLAACGAPDSQAPAPSPPPVAVARDAPGPSCEQPTTTYQVAGTTAIVDRDGHRLWRGACGDGGRVVVASPDASFERAFPTADGGLLYTGPGGVWRVDVATGETREVYTTPVAVDDDCMALPRMRVEGRPPPRPGAIHDVLDGVSDGGATLVLVRRGEDCHPPAAWIVHVTTWATAPAEHATHPIHDLAVAGGVVYYIDGDGLWGRAAGTTKRVTTAGVLGVPNRVVATTRGLVIRAGHGDWGGARVDHPGELWLSVDRGTTWKPIRMPEPFAFWLAAPTPDELVFGGTSDDANKSRAWHSRDGGRSWTSTGDAPPDRVTTRMLGGATYEATDDGLYVTRGGVRTQVTDPLTKALGGDRF